jgi:hypothetical protein
MSEAESRPGFWQTLPGILTGIAAVVTAVTGLVAALVQFWPDSMADAPATSATADAIAGRWSGQARDIHGTGFEISLEIGPGCAVGARCGWIRVSHVPCQGDIALVSSGPEGFEFDVSNFSADSGTACTPGAGELFRLLPDGNLLYTTTYEPKASAILIRAPS